MSSFPRRSAPCVVALAVTALLANALSPLSAQTAPPEPPPQDPIPVGPMARGQSAIERLGRSLPIVAGRYRLDGVELRDLFLADPSLAVDPDGELVHLDPLAPGEEVLVVLPSDAGADASFEIDVTIDAATDPGSVDDEDGSVAAAPTDDVSADDGDVFELSSLPGADLTIYLDFDGHVTEGTSWNSAYGVASIVSPPYDLDGSPERWSSEELDAIANTWASVAVDFDPWNVNVTTVEPPVDDLRRIGDEDTRWGARVVFSADTFAECGCGGQAYIGAFDDADDEATFVHNNGVEVLAESATHQVGHLLGQAHDGSIIGTTSHRSLGPRPVDPNDEPTDDEPTGGGSEGQGTETEPPAVPIGIVGVDLGGAVFLGWVPNDEDDLLGYVVEWSTSPDGPFSVIATTSLNGHVDVAPSPGDNHYRVSAEDLAGNRSAPVELMVAVVAPPTPDR